MIPFVCIGMYNPAMCVCRWLEVVLCHYLSIIDDLFCQVGPAVVVEYGT